ncbi:MAG: hypothetical protein L6Q31_12825 [Fimbriimonadaceae bacterium]|nr:hypothetical protein [Fimbriimonadaceae bacterium]RIK01489.1 MAG: hypothetical protein DCC46_00110 [Armatimonadota bacterium]
MAISLVAYLHVVSESRPSKYFGGLLITDARGQPVEFVHNSVDAPSGFLWSGSEVRRVAVQVLAHSLFDGCLKSPALLVAPQALGPPAYCSEELAPSIPFAQVLGAGESGQTELSWIGSPPAPSTATSALAEELRRRKLLIEPFTRIERALREVYPQLSTSE